MQISTEMKEMFSFEYGITPSLLPLPITDDNDFTHQDLRRNDGSIQSFGRSIRNEMNFPKLYFLPKGRILKKMHNITNSGTFQRYILNIFLELETHKPDQKVSLLMYISQF